MMRILLACLMCEILPISQVWAIDGGPVFGGGGHVNTVGTYAGLLLPRPVVTDPGPPEVTETDNSLGLFTASVPRTGLATGTAGIFRNGYFYPGTIQALADPDSARLTGIFSATFDITFGTVNSTTGVVTTFVVTYNANGQIKGRIVPGQAFSAASARLRGNANITYNTIGGTPDPQGNSGGPVVYKIHGFKQSDQTSGTATGG